MKRCQFCICVQQSLTNSCQTFLLPLSPISAPLIRVRVLHHQVAAPPEFGHRSVVGVVRTLRRPASTAVSIPVSLRRSGTRERASTDWRKLQKTTTFRARFSKKHRARVGSDTKCNTPATPGPTPVTPGSSLGSLDWPHRPTLVFSAHFVLTRADRKSVV